jgi:uncharacterized protein YqgC (DUF456 family)
MERRNFVGWLPDIARASIVSVLFFAATMAGILFMYVLGVLAIVLGYVLGPWMAAWVACLILAPGRRSVARLATGAICGLLLGLVVLHVADKSHLQLNQEVEGVLIIAGWIVGPFLGALAFSRMPRRGHTEQ